MRFTDVYVADIVEQIDLTNVYPSERQQEIERVNNPKLKRQKWCSWKLLEYALKHSFGLKIDQCSFVKNDNGKWSTDKCEFSMSHCDGAVAVAVSEKNVGVDIESNRSFSCERIARKILAEKEKLIYEQLSDEERHDFLLEKWTAKESLFKRDGGKVFVPEKYDTTINDVYSEKIKLKESEYQLSVASDDIDGIKIYTDINILNENI